MIAEKLGILTTVNLECEIEDRWTLPTHLSRKMHMQRLEKVNESNDYLRR